MSEEKNQGRIGTRGLQEPWSRNVVFPPGLGVSNLLLINKRSLEQCKSFNYFHMVTNKSVKVTATLL